MLALFPQWKRLSGMSHCRIGLSLTHKAVQACVSHPRLEDLVRRSGDNNKLVGYIGVFFRP